MLDWIIEAREVGGEGRSIDRVATVAECAELATTLDIPALRALKVTGKVKALSRDRFAIAGVIVAHLVQTCVVTLEPLEAEVREEMEVELWPVEALAAEESATREFATSGPEPYEAGKLRLGELVVQHLLAAMDPFPRKNGAALDWADGAARSVEVSPFAVLAKLKDKGDG